MGPVLFDYVVYFHLFSFGKVAVEVFGAVVLLTRGSVSKPQHASVRVAPRLPWNVTVPRRMRPSRAGVPGRGGVSSVLWGSALGAEASSLLWLAARPRPPGGR